MRSTNTRSARGIERQLNVNAVLARTDEGERVRFVDQALQTFDAPLHFAGAHEVAQPTDDLAGADGLLLPLRRALP